MCDLLIFYARLRLSYSIFVFKYFLTRSVFFFSFYRHISTKNIFIPYYNFNINLKIIFHNVSNNFQDFIKYADDTIFKIHIYLAEVKFDNIISTFVTSEII